MDELWIPSSAEELEAAVDAGVLTETHFQEYKQFAVADDGKTRLPPTLAKSMAGLAVDGGVIIIGVAEDKSHQEFTCAPQPLKGLRDAVDAKALTALSPSLRVTSKELHRGDGTGYLVVVVPQSPRAPHMVEGRYYGRGESSTRSLADGEVRRLWSRHLERRAGIHELLAIETGREPVEFYYQRNARLFVVAQPVSADPRLLLEAVPDKNLLEWVQWLSNEQLYRRHRDYAPTFASEGTVQRRAHGVARTCHFVESDRSIRRDGDNQPSHSRIVDLEFWEDGGLRLYYGRASDELKGQSWILLDAIAGEVAGIIEAARVISAVSGFRGSWSFGVTILGIRGLAAYRPNSFLGDGWGFSEDDYTEVVEVDHVTLHEDASPVLESLVGRLVRATTGDLHRVPALDPFPKTLGEPAGDSQR